MLSWALKRNYYWHAICYTKEVPNRTAPSPSPWFLLQLQFCPGSLRPSGSITCLVLSSSSQLYFWRCCINLSVAIPVALQSYRKTPLIFHFFKERNVPFPILILESAFSYFPIAGSIYACMHMLMNNTFRLLIPLVKAILVSCDIFAT